MKTRTQAYKTVKRCSCCRKHTHDIRNCHASDLMVEKIHSDALAKMLQGRTISFDPFSLKCLKYLYRRLYPMRRIYMCSRAWIIKELLRHYRTYIRLKHPHIIYRYDKKQTKKQCPVCLSSKICMQTNCNHPICRECYYSYLDKTDTGKLACPLCRTKIQEMNVCQRCVF